MTPLIRRRDGGGEEGGVGEGEHVGQSTWADGRAAFSASWEPVRSSSSTSVNDIPTFDVVDDNTREKMARKAEKRLVERTKTYLSARASKHHRTRLEKDDESSIASARSRSRSLAANPLDRTSSLTPAARALLEASNNARNSDKNLNLFSSNSSSHPSRIFSSSSVVSGMMNAGSRDSFGSSLRMSYTPNRPTWSGAGGEEGKHSTPSLRLAAGGATPR